MITKRNVVNGAAGLGSAICVAVACNVYKDFDEAVQHMVKIKDVFYPKEENVKIYQQILPIYKDITKHTDNILKKSYELFK